MRCVADAYFPLSFQSLSYSDLLNSLLRKRNEKWMRSQGAYEAGADHYPCMVAMHVAFFVSLIGEVILFDTSLSTVWILFLVIFLVAQVLHGFGVSLHLGSFGIRKSSFLPGADVVRKGPYQLDSSSELCNCYD